MCGWLRAAIARPSCSRLARSSTLASACPTTLMATVRSRRVSRARYTSPMPPWPIAAVISYGPSRVEDLRATGPGLRSAVRSRGIAQVQVVHEAMQIGRVDPEQPRRRRVIAARALDGVEDQAAF